MAGIRGRDTRPEWIVRRYLHPLSFRYRLHARDLPGRPDLVMPRYNAAILVRMAAFGTVTIAIRCSSGHRVEKNSGAQRFGATRRGMRSEISYALVRTRMASRYSLGMRVPGLHARDQIRICRIGWPCGCGRKTHCLRHRHRSADTCLSTSTGGHQALVGSREADETRSPPAREYGATVRHARLHGLSQRA